MHAFRNVVYVVLILLGLVMGIYITHPSPQQGAFLLCLGAWVVSGILTLFIKMPLLCPLATSLFVGICISVVFNIIIQSNAL